MKVNFIFTYTTHTSLLMCIHHTDHVACVLPVIVILISMLGALDTCQQG